MKKPINKLPVPIVWSPVLKDTALADLLELVAIEIVKQRRKNAAAIRAEHVDPEFDRDRRKEAAGEVIDLRSASHPPGPHFSPDLFCSRLVRCFSDDRNRVQQQIQPMENKKTNLGPVRLGSPLYRLMELLAARTAKHLSAPQETDTGENSPSPPLKHAAPPN